MPFDQIRAAEPRPGRTVPLILDTLPGKPTIHVEAIADTNETYWNDQIAKANTKKALGFGGSKKLSKKEWAARRRTNREILAKHAIRDLDALHSDGRKATKADIPDFVEALPNHIVDMIRDFVLNPENFRDDASVEGDSDEIAEK